MNSFYQALPEDSRTWVDQTLDGLSLDELIGQKLAPLINVAWDPSRTRDALIERALQYQVGAVHACSHLPPPELHADLATLQSGLKVPALVSSDFETDAAYPGAVRCGSGMAFGAIADPAKGEALARRSGALAARQGLAIGVNWTFGPVVDLLINPENPITATRSFSRDPDRVGALAAAMIDGFQSGGMAATAKHFPGDGMDNRDQHAATPYNPLPMDRWHASYGKTFGAAIDAGVHAVMIGHIALSARAARDPQTGMLLPATLDAGLLKGLLRDEMGFQGIIVSDAIAMGGAHGHVQSVSEASVRHILAGGDMVLFVEELDRVVAGVKAALHSGRYTADDLRESVRRILTIKATLGLHRRGEHTEDVANTLETIRPKVRQLAGEIAESSVTLVRDLKQTLPLRLAEGAKIVVCVCPDEPIASQGIALPDAPLADDEWPVAARLLRDRGFKVTCVRTLNALVKTFPESDAAILISRCRPAAGRNSIRLSHEGVRCFHWPVINSGKPVVYLNMGDPYTLWQVAPMPNCICTYHDGEAAHDAAVRAVLGELQCPGRLPVPMDFDAMGDRLAALSEPINGAGRSSAPDSL